MPSLILTHHAARATDIEWSHISQLDTVMIDGTAVLFATTRYDGELTSWTIDSGVMTLRDTQAHSGVLRAGGSGAFTTLMIDGQSSLISGGGVGGALTLRTYDTTG